MSRWEYMQMEVVYDYRSRDKKKWLYISKIDGIDPAKENNRRWDRRVALEQTIDEYEEFDVVSRLNEYGQKGWELVSSQRIDFRWECDFASPVVIYTLKRRKSDPAKILNGIVSPLEVSPESDLEKKIGDTQRVIDVTIKSLMGEDASADSYSREQLNRIFEIDTDSESLINLVRAGKVSIESIILDTRSNNVSEYSVSSSYQISIEVRNDTRETLLALIPKGQIFENVEASFRNGFQNIVNSEDFFITLEARQGAVFFLPGYCLNQMLQSPSGQDASITPLKICFEFSNQADVWENIKTALQA